MPITVEQIEIREIQMPLVSYFETSFGRTDRRRIILVSVFAEGIVGYGEATSPEGPFYNHESTETAWHLLKDFIVPRVLKKRPATVDEISPLLKLIRGHAMAKAAVETAYWDLEAKRKGLPLCQLLGGERSILTAESRSVKVRHSYSESGRNWKQAISALKSDQTWLI
jgi:O-succinylbenzoate synthase